MPIYNGDKFEWIYTKGGREYFAHAHAVVPGFFLERSGNEVS